MKNIFLIIISGIIVSISLCSCEDFIEKKISKSEVKINVPANNAVFINSSVSIIWEPVDGADAYNLQIAQPNFSQMQSFIIDSTTKATKFTRTFGPGKYECRIKAINGSEQTVYTSVFFSIDSSLSMANQSVILNSPANNLTSKDLTYEFSWQEVPLADDYRFEIREAGTTIYSNTSVTGNSISYTFTKGGTYKWRVKAQNDFGSSPYTEYTLIIDNSVPNTPILTQPADNDSSIIANAITLKAGVTFRWKRGSNSGGSAITDSLYIYQTSTSNSPHKSFYTTDSTLTDTLQRGTYFWKVRSIDAAGNRSNYSSFFKFKIK